MDNLAKSLKVCQKITENRGKAGEPLLATQDFRTFESIANIENTWVISDCQNWRVSAAYIADENASNNCHLG